MSVLLTNTTATLRRQQIGGGLDSHGEEIATGYSAPVGNPLPALIEQRSDGGWSVNLDDSLWPVREGDMVVRGDGATFVVRTAEHMTNAFDSTVNYVRCEALRVSADGTEPADPWFVGRE